MLTLFCGPLLLASLLSAQSLFDSENIPVGARQQSASVPGVNLPPRFLPGGDMSRFSLPEDTPVGTIVYRLRGEDPEGTRVAYSISGDHLSVTRNTGVVTLVKPLDRETQDVLEVIVTITDEKGPSSEPNIVSIRREIQIEDRNDNPPKFSEAQYLAVVNETAAKGTRFFNKVFVSDADLGPNADIQLSCITELSPEACAKFNVSAEKISNGKYAGVLSVLGPLDYEQRSRYAMVIRAEDQSVEPGTRLSSTATVVIDLLDVQDQPPVFLNAPYAIVLNENSPEGMTLQTILVRDGDAGIPRQLRLEIVDEARTYFQLSPLTVDEEGISKCNILTGATPIDRENELILQQGGLYKFFLKATELIDGVPSRDFSVAPVSVVVVDVNDNAPVFDKTNYVAVVPEGIKAGFALPGLEILVTDSDSAANAQFELSLTSSTKNAEEVFEVLPTSATSRTPVQIRVVDGSKLDYEIAENREMVVVLTARDGVHRPSTATVTIMLADVNDNKPVFPDSSFRFSVAEDTPPGTLINRLEATDADNGTFGQVRYELHGFGADKFVLNETNGDLFVADCGFDICLDYETQKSYTFAYHAIDGGGLSSAVQLIIDVEDVNDNAPLFEVPEYRRVIPNGASEIYPPLVVTAVDKDFVSSDKLPSQITYSIITPDNLVDLFVIDHSQGRIDITRPINMTELGTSRIAFSVKATDSGIPPLSSESNVIITIGSADSKDPPKFTQDTYSAIVKEKSPSGSYITQVNATNPVGRNENVRYGLVADPFIDWFQIDDVSGIIRVADELSLPWEHDSEQHLLLVTAVDKLSSQSQTATASVIVEVEDINDKPPKFSKALFVHHVAEITAVGTNVLVLAANDPDSTALLSFQLVGPFVRRDKGGYAHDENESSYFSISESTGILTVTKPLDHDNAAVLNFNVEVNDINADPQFPNQTDTAEVIIYVQAHSDNGPIFAAPWSPAHPIIKEEVPEEQEPGNPVLILKAHDPLTGILVNKYKLLTDNPEAEALTMEDGGKDASEGTSRDVQMKSSDVTREDITSLIDLDSVNGYISFKKKIDYEELANKTLEFQVLAITGPPEAERSSQATIQLTILDKNDNSPQFTKQEYHVQVPESIKFPEPLLTVQATDKDSGKFGTVLYYVSGDGADIFVIDDPQSGVIRVAPNVSLDREKQPSYTFTVIAADQPQGGEEQRRTSAFVTVEVSDVNDNAPQFTQSSYTAVVPENAPLDWSVAKVQATDRDEGDGGQVQYLLVEEGRLKGSLSVDGTTGDLLVKGPLTGKGRSDPYVVTIRAQDQGDPQLHTDTDVNVYVGDITANDGIPSFIKPAFNEQAFVSEDAPVGTSVFQAIATDPDDAATPNGRLIYKFLDDGVLGSDHSFFDIHPGSGIITTKAKLDRETKASYTLILVARDQGNPPQQATRILKVIVKDVDDHPPLFSRTTHDGPLEFRVLEEVEPGWEVDTLRAIDPDEGENAAIEYLITYGDDAGLFRLERTVDNAAKLLVRGKIDRETADHFLLTVKCFTPAAKPTELRKPYNPLDLSEIQVLVVVEDIDDNDPVFKQSNISTGVRLNVPLHTEVVRLEAVDPDAQTTSLQYKLVNISFIRAEHYATSGSDAVIDSSPTISRTFELDPNTGSLTTSQTYGHFVDGYFLLYVSCWSGDEARARKAYAIVRVYILRDTELMKFVFTKPPPDVKPKLPEFQQAVEQALDLPLTLNLYESQFYAREDGALDFGSTSSCFQIVGKDHVFDVKDTQQLLSVDRNKVLRDVFDKYSVKDVERCVPRGKLYEIRNVEIWLVVIGSLVGIVTFMAAITICCLFTRYESRMLKAVPGIKVLQRPVQVLRTQNLPPRNMSISESQMIYDWQESSQPVDAGSRVSIARSVL